MTEGWRGDDYFVLFSGSEVLEQSDRYGIAEILPGFRVLGLIGWDDFIVQDAAGATFKIPTVPCDPQYLEPLQLPDPEKLQADSRFRGKIKWYVQPVVFGGDPNAGDNLTWVAHDKHVSLVRWWNTNIESSAEANREYSSASAKARIHLNLVFGKNVLPCRDHAQRGITDSCSRTNFVGRF